MVRKIKAAADVMLLIGMAIGLVLIFFDFTPAWYEGDVYKVMLHSHMYGMSNSLDAAGLYVNTSMDYSVYQALYETLKGGGFETIEEGKGESGLAYWSDSSSSITTPSKEQVEVILQKRIEANLGKYTKAGYDFTVDYHVTFPDYKVSIQDESGNLKVTTSAEDANLSITKLTQEYGMKEDVMMKRTLLPEGVYDIDYARMLEIGESENPNIISELQETMENEVDSWEKVTQTIPDTDSLKNNLQSSIESNPDLVFTRTQGDYAIESNIHRISVGRVSDQNKDGTYTNNYDATVILKITVSYNKEDFPVYDSTTRKVIMDKISLIFLDKLSYKASS